MDALVSLLNVITTNCSRMLDCFIVVNSVCQFVTTDVEMKCNVDTFLILISLQNWRENSMNRSADSGERESESINHTLCKGRIYFIGNVSR